MKEAALEVGDLLIGLVDPESTGEVADDLFGAVAGFGVGVTEVVDDNGVATIAGGAARIGEGAELEDAGDGDLLAAARIGLLALPVILFAALCGLPDLLVDAIVFLLQVLGRKGLAVLAEEFADGDAAQPEDPGGRGFAFAEGAMLVGAVERGGFTIDIVALAKFVGALVSFDRMHEGGDVGQRAGDLLRRQAGGQEHKGRSRRAEKPAEVHSVIIDGGASFVAVGVAKVRSRGRVDQRRHVRGPSEGASIVTTGTAGARLRYRCLPR